MEKTEWIRCPVCGNKTRLQIREDTELKNFPLYCPKCKQESLIEAKDLQVTVVKRLKRKCQINWQSDKSEFIVINRKLEVKHCEKNHRTYSSYG